MEPVDGIAFLGRNPNSKNVYIITGDSGDGISQGTVGAMIITDLVHGRENKWAKIYDPARISFKSAGQYLKENMNVAVQYLDWIGGAHGQSVMELPKQEGLVISNGLKRLAVYKDESGKILLHSAVCPHLGGIVAWNSVEKSWDCPCHGSRFDCKGRVIEGPAVDDLEAISEKDKPKIREKIFARSESGRI